MRRRSDSLPTTLAAARAAVTAQREAVAAAERRAIAAEARAAAAENEAKSYALQIEKLKFTIAKLRHAQFGQSAERGAILEQLELQLADLEENAAQAQAQAELADAAAATVVIKVEAFERKRPARRPLPAELPRERVVHPAPTACPCCGGATLRKIGEDVTEMLEHVPASWKVIQHVREKFSCRSCETIAQTPAPSHPIARGRAGPMLLAHILFCKYGLHLPLNRQSMTYRREGVDLDVSTLCDWVGAAAATLMPLVEEIRAHVFAAERIHADDTPVKVLAKGKCRTGRLWTYVRDDRAFAGTAAPAAAFFYSPDRGGAHPDAHLATYAGLMQADAYAGFNRLYEAGRKPGPVTAAMCWAHARRKFFDVARLNKAPIAIEAVARIDVLFEIERDINGKPPPERQRVRAEHSRPLVAELKLWLQAQRAKLSAHSETAKAIAYSLNRWSGLVRFLDDGRLCMTNNAAERALRCVAVGLTTGPSQVRTKAGGAPQPSTRSSRRQSSAASTRARGSPTCSPGCPIIRQEGSPSCCPGTGSAIASWWRHEGFDHPYLDHPARYRSRDLAQNRGAGEHDARRPARCHSGRHGLG
jgi:transposase